MDSSYGEAIKEAVDLLRAAGWTVEKSITQENCPHPPELIRGSASVSTKGSGHSEATCSRCGKHWEHDWPANANALVWARIY